MSKFINNVVLLTSAVLFLFASEVIAQNHFINGLVLDTSGNPIDGVDVSLEIGNIIKDSDISKDGGRYKVEFKDCSFVKLIFANSKYGPRKFEGLSGRKDNNVNAGLPLVNQISSLPFEEREEIYGTIAYIRNKSNLYSKEIGYYKDIQINDLTNPDKFNRFASIAESQEFTRLDSLFNRAFLTPTALFDKAIKTQYFLFSDLIVKDLAIKKLQIVLPIEKTKEWLLTSETKLKLNELIKEAINLKNYQIIIQGFTDSTGEEKENISYKYKFCNDC